MSTPQFIKLDWGNWLYSLVWAFIGGGAGAVTSGVVVSAFDPKDFNFQTGRFYGLVLAVFTVNGVLSSLAFLHQQPLPKIETTTTTTIETTKQEDKPKAIVVTTVEKVEKVETKTAEPTKPATK